MSTNTYWSRYWRDRRSSRRRFLGAASAIGAGAAGFALVGCGDDDDDSDGNASPTSGSSPASGASATAPASATAAPGGNGGERVAGGTARFPLYGTTSGDPPTLFPFENVSYLPQVISGYHYSLLLRDVAGPDIDPADYTALEGDVADSWEQPDDTTYVFKWKPNVKWHDKEPLNGREATPDDFAQTYQAFITLSQSAGAYDEIIESLEATDAQTLTIKLNAPFAPFLASYASSPRGIWFVPVETINNQQVQTDPVGTGPFVFRQWDSGVSIRWDRNPNYYASPVPWFDALEAGLIADPQRLLAAVQAGDLDWAGLTGSLYEQATQSLDPAGKEIVSPPPNNVGFFFNFDVDGGRWRDKRLRQALSMAMDRDGYLDVLDPTGQGGWNSHMPMYLPPYYVSPKSDEFGDNAKNFQYNPEEAKALLQAATGGDTIDFVINANVDRYGAGYQQHWELVASQLRQVGFNPELNYQPYSSYIQSTYLGDMTEGVGLGPFGTSSRDPDDLFSNHYASASARNNWGGTPIDEQEELDRRFLEQQQIIDLEERIAYVRDLVNSMADSMLFVPSVAAATFGYVNPWVEGYYEKVGYSSPRATVAEASFTQERIDRGP